MFSQRRYRIISFGTPAFDREVMKEIYKERNSIGKRYHVRYVRKNTCIGKARWVNHNKRVRTKLDKINGKGWEEKMEKEIVDHYK